MDSAQRISGTPSNFKVSVVRDVALPKGCAAFASDVYIPHTWLSVDEFCNRLYWDEYALGSLVKFNLASLEPQNYSGAALADAMEPLVATDHPSEWDSGPNQIQITNWGTDAQGKVIYLKNYQTGATGQLHCGGCVHSKRSWAYRLYRMVKR